MTLELIDAADRPGVARLRIDFGEANLLTPDRLARLRDRLAAVPDGTAVVVVEPAHPDGGPTGLCGGLHLGAVADLDAAGAEPVIDRLYRTIEAVRDLDAVTVCDCGTYALGAGFELALACDFRVATRDATLGLPEVDVGLVTGIQGGLLIRHVGLARAKELIYLGEPLGGAEAEAAGLVTRATGGAGDGGPDADGGAATDDTARAPHVAGVEALVDRLADKEPEILRRQKATFRDWRSNGLEAGMRESGDAIAACFDTAAQERAMGAFLGGGNGDGAGGDA